MSVKFHQRNITVNNKTFMTKFYIGDPGDFCIEPTCIANSTDTGANAKTWGSQGVYGSNASFFGTGGTPATTAMAALHIYNNRNMIDKNGNDLGGNQNLELAGNPNTALDFLYYTGSTVGHKAKTPSWYPTATQNQGISNMQWGIGGFNMLLSDLSITSQATFDTALVKYYPNIRVNYKGTTSRTAIGYRGGTDKKIVLITIFGSTGTTSNGPTMYEVNAVMKYLGCSVALCLDGSTCTKISYKKNNVNEGIDSSSRQSWCRIRLTVSAASTTDWTGV